MTVTTKMLGVDFGAQRIGVAASEGRIAVPLTIVEHENRERDLERVATIARERDVSAVVIGLPLLESGGEGDQARRARRFGDALARRLEVPVVYHDERFSSVQADFAEGDAAPARSGGHSRAKRRIDDAAAAVILQAYIDAADAAPSDAP